MKPQRMVAEALVEPLAALGWQKRAWGWFTWPVHDGYLGVLALGSASEHTRPGSALIAPLIGLRHEEIEETVAELCDLKSDYRMRSVTGALGYQTPEKTYKEWLVDSPAVADQAAREITADVDRYGMPYLRSLINSASALLDTIRHHPNSAPEFCRRTVAAALLGNQHIVADERRMIADRVAAAPDGMFRDQVVAMIGRLDPWLASRDPRPA